MIVSGVTMFCIVVIRVLMMFMHYRFLDMPVR